MANASWHMAHDSWFNGLRPSKDRMGTGVPDQDQGHAPGLAMGHEAYAESQGAMIQEHHECRALYFQL